MLIVILSAKHDFRKRMISFFFAADCGSIAKSRFCSSSSGARSLQYLSHKGDPALCCPFCSSWSLTGLFATVFVLESIFDSRLDEIEKGSIFFYLLDILAFLVARSF